MIEISKEKCQKMFIKNYMFSTSDDSVIYVQDEMGESPLTFSLTAQLLEIAAKRKCIEFAEFQKCFEASKKVILLDKR